MDRAMTLPTTLLAALAGLGLAVALLLCVWVASLARRDASLVDRFWGAGFVLLAGFWAWTSPSGFDGAGPRLSFSIAALWGVRLSLHLTWRNWGHGEDYRYAAMRRHHGDRFPIVSLFTVFLLQAVLMWVIALPLLALARAAGTPAPLALTSGLLVFGAGFLFEVVADAQLALHKADPRRTGPLDRGLWRYSRHPNYFGEALLWWGIWIIASSVDGAWTVLSPVLMTFLLVRVSGVALLEKRLRTDKPGWDEYARRTSAFVPWPPRRRTRR
jgi:steroid 5-alpha reductase family enzyme